MMIRLRKCKTCSSGLPKKRKRLINHGDYSEWHTDKTDGYCGMCLWLMKHEHGKFLEISKGQS